MMKQVLLSVLFFVLLSAGQLLAHPGIGIVSDSRGNIFFTDLKHVWKQTPGGEKSIAVRDVHTHELYMDGQDNLYGEHLWYDRELTDKWWHYTWVLQRDGRLVKTESTEGFPHNYSCQRDSLGNMYLVESGDTSVFYKVDLKGNKTRIASGVFPGVKLIHSTPAGGIYFADREDLYKISDDGTFLLIAAGLAIGDIGTILTDNKHSIFGIWTDTKENIYAAVYSDKCIKRISGNGEVTIVYTSSPGFSPTGGMFDKNGNMWVLETGAMGTRVVRAVPESASSLYVYLNNNGITIAIGFIVMLSGFSICKIAFRNRMKPEGRKGDIV